MLPKHFGQKPLCLPLAKQADLVPGATDPLPHPQPHPQSKPMH